MNNFPQVSVVIPFLNAEKFLQETIDSVFSQIYSNWELLLVDDGSTDASTAIACDYATKHPDKVRYFEHEGHQNRGACASRNLGIRNAKGKYIALLDADDIWLPHKLERQVAILESCPEAGMVYGATKYWKSWTGNAEDTDADFVPKICTHAKTLFQPPKLAIVCYPLGQATAPCPSDLLLRRDVVERIGGFVEEFPNAYQLYEDQAFLLKVYLATPVLVVNECWDLYRIHPESCVAKATAANQYEIIRLFFLNWLEKYLIEQGFKDTEVWNLLQKILWTYRNPILYKIQKFTQDLRGKIKALLRSMGRLILPNSIRDWLKLNFKLQQNKI
jgi:glycosyltransferase involved in cell wall biosynthesis